MYLSRLILNPLSRSVWRDLADCQALHRTVMSGFLGRQLAGDARSALQVLHRLEIHPRSGQITLLVQSAEEPDWAGLERGYLAEVREELENPATKPIAPHYGRIRAGDILEFRLAANPTRKIETKSGPGGERRNGRRVEIRDDEAKMEWLRLKGEQGGFRVRSARVRPPETARGGKILGTHGNDHGARLMTFGGAVFEGELLVTDSDLFMDTLRSGVGSGKAYGFGLLSIAPARR